jgi:hypothetical protein
MLLIRRLILSDCNTKEASEYCEYYGLTRSINCGRDPPRYVLPKRYPLFTRSPDSE